jgi:chemotaxis protein methyltransferase CheR
MKRFGPQELSQVQALIEERSGLRTDTDQLAQLSHVLEECLAKSPAKTVNEYVEGLRDESFHDREFDALIVRLTVNETYFFRDTAQLAMFQHVLLPATFERAQHEQRTLRILSAGCSSGEEAYSLSILAHQKLGPLAKQVEIVGIDINRDALEKARNARYSEWSLRQTPAETRSEYFRVDKQAFALVDHIRQTVRFEHRNLVDADTPFWARNAFDIISCRNVFIYFSSDTIRTVISKFAHALTDKGYLLLGSAETLRGISNQFGLVHANSSFAYQKGAAALPPADLPITGTSTAPPAFQAAPTLSAPELPDQSWADAIANAAQRLAQLSETQSRPPEASTKRTQYTENEVVALFRAENYSQVKSALASTPLSGMPRRMQLLQAAANALTGAIEDAERFCRHMLATDSFCAEAHFVLGMCREHQGDRVEAVNQFKQAFALDPTFALAQLHFGMGLRRIGQNEGAKAALKSSLKLITSETAERVLLFGGGFGREGIAQLAQAELAACRGNA